ncbi:N-acetyltransferase [Actinocrispum sp. NPDC049592]|uniref:N-acetyltransferase n=1 Tax=Actinocrispum sp. NPDC049592 TaxID=3154835 RepID=UPI00343B2F03
MTDTTATSAHSGGESTFVPPDFSVPTTFVHDEFHLTPLRPEHNPDDYRAWTSSKEHIRRTPGFEHYGWPVDMTIEENRRDLVQHADDFTRRVGFTYSVISGEEVIGCVYIYPDDKPGHAQVRSWVREDRAQLDVVLYELVDEWLRDVWPFKGYSYSPRTRELSRY